MTCVQYLLCMCDRCLQIAHSCVSCTLICVRLVALFHCRVGWTSLQQAPVKVAVEQQSRQSQTRWFVNSFTVAICRHCGTCAVFHLLLCSPGLHKYIGYVWKYGSVWVPTNR